MRTDIAKQVVVQLIVFELNAFSRLTEVFLIGPLKGIRVQCLLSFEFSLSIVRRIDLFWRQDKLLHDAVEGHSGVIIDLSVDSHNNRIMSVISDTESIEGQEVLV